MTKLMTLCTLFMLIFLGTHNGYLALYQATQKEPSLIYPYLVTIYPKTDQQILQDGIIISDQRDLSSLLDDYLS